MRKGSPESPGVAGSFRNRAPSKGIAFRGDSGYLNYTYSDAGQNYHRSQGERTVGKASFSGFSTRAGNGPGRPGCAVPTLWHRRCRPAGTKPTGREPGANSCDWRAKSGHRLPGPACAPNARKPGIRNAGGVARLRLGEGRPDRAATPRVLGHPSSGPHS